MSHNAQYRSCMTSLETIEQACTRIGLTLHRNQTTSRFYQGQVAPCDHAIRIPNTTFEVGLIKQADGTYAMNMDTYDRTLLETMGQKGERFLQQYVAAAAVAEAKQHRRVAVKETRLQNGTIRLQLISR